MPFAKYSKWTGVDGESLSLEELLDRLADFLLQSGFDNSYYEDWDDRQRSLERSVSGVRDGNGLPRMSRKQHRQSIPQSLDCVGPVVELRVVPLGAKACLTVRSRQPPAMRGNELQGAWRLGVVHRLSNNRHPLHIAADYQVRVGFAYGLKLKAEQAFLHNGHQLDRQPLRERMSHRSVDDALSQQRQDSIG